MGLDQWFDINDNPSYSGWFDRFYDIPYELYFRKNNSLHNWICSKNNVDPNDPEVSSIQVTVEQLRELDKILDAVVNKCKKYIDGSITQKEFNEFCSSIYPTKSGFFFGDTSYDDWYVKQIERQSLIVENIVNRIPDDIPEDFKIITYTVSW